MVAMNAVGYHDKRTYLKDFMANIDHNVCYHSTPLNFLRHSMIDKSSSLVTEYFV